MTAALRDHGDTLGVPTLSTALGVGRAPPIAARPHRGGAPKCKAHVHAERLVDQSPAQLFATRLDEDTSLSRPRTMYRMLTAYHAVRECRAQCRHAPHAVPRLTATPPNQVWRLIATASRRHGMVPGQLTTHRDRGRMHIAKDLHALSEDLGLVRSLSRPRVSNDHPYVESLFTTTTYIAGYPDRFTDFAHAEPWCTAFFTYDNTMHKHSGIASCTPAMVYGGDASAVLAQRHRTMTRAFGLTPARFVRGAPRTATLPTTVSIHPIAEHHAAAINTP